MLFIVNCNFTGQQEIEQKRWIFVAVFTQMMVFYLWEYYVYKGYLLPIAAYLISLILLPMME